LPARCFRSPLPPSARDAVPAEAAAALVAAADRVLGGTWSMLGTVRHDSADPDWFLDPVTGLRAPDRRSAFRINHRDEAVTGNVKQVWELSRHHHLTVLATAWWLTGDERYAEAVAGQLRSWWRANPFLSGIHWTSGIEAGIRLLAWVWIRRLLDDWPKAGDLFENDPDALRQIAWHQEFLAGFVSTGSSANNHLIAEAAGRLAAACAFDWYDRSPRWRASAAAELERSLAANTFPDGLNRELATDYHRFVLELALVAAAEADAAGHPLGTATWGLITRMLDAGVAVLDAAGRPPRQGDGDEGRALVVDEPERDPWAVTLDAGGALVGRLEWWPALAPSVLGTVVSALASPARSGDRSRRPTQPPRRFPDAGCVILRSRPVDGLEIWCRMDVGPHGFGSIAAHAHADALALEVRHDGVDVLADPGTYCYHGEPAWRDWFRSTAGHNTLQVAEVDQARSGGPFLWTTRPVTSTVSCQVGEAALQSVVAEHDGYQRLPLPAVHRRSVTLDSPSRTLRIEDVLDSAGEHPVRLSWHLGPEVEVQLDHVRARLSWPARGGRGAGELHLPAELTWTAARGAEEPPEGWYSPGFGVRVPAVTMIGLGRLTGGSRLVTTLRLP
ncbi:MAG TPA: alginate lyase family protein, partial [Kineosporiaceae bacterium]